MGKPVYTLVPGSELYDLHRKYGKIRGMASFMSPDEWPFTLDESSPRPPAGKVSVVEFEHGVYWLLAGSEPGQLTQFDAIPVPGNAAR